jgi:hypothetical protein
MTCAACRKETTLVFAADGQPVDFDAHFPAHRLMLWLSAARRAMASGMPGVAVGCCSGCSMPLVISSKQEVTLPCPHCQKPVQGPAETLLVDQWPEPWTQIETGGLSLEYRLAWVDDSTAITAGCPCCGAPTAADDPSTQCPRCRSVTWVQKKDVRMQLGVRINGMRHTNPYNVIVSIPQGEATLRSDNVMSSSASSSSSILGVGGVGCAIAIALFSLMIIGIVILAYFSK